MVLIDAGHGGIDPRSGKYTTSPAKMFRFKDWVGHGDGYFYEGVINRQISKRLEDMLKEANIPFAPIYHEWLDTSLRVRMGTANKFAKRFKNVLLISIHNNASPNHNARGTEVFTSIGKSPADKLAKDYIRFLEEEIRNNRYDIKVRKDLSDGDSDKEAKFTMISSSHLYGILVECLFFDEIRDAKMINTPEIQEMFARSIFKAIKNFYE